MSWTATQPWLLTLALAAVPCALLGLRLFGPMSPVRRWASVLIRAFLLLLLALMLAGAARVKTTHRRSVVAVVDLSHSVVRFSDLGVDEAGERITIEQAARAWLDAAVGQRTADDLLGIITVGSSPAVGAMPSSAGVLGRGLPAPPGEQSDLASALRLGGSIIPPDTTGRIVLLSDGNETRGDARTTAQMLAGGGLDASSNTGAGVVIDVVPIPLRVDREVFVESVDAPPVASGESTVRVRVVLRATAPVSGVLRLAVEGETIDINGPADGTGLRVGLEAGRRVVTIPVELGPRRVHRFAAVFEPDLGDTGQPVGDTSTANNRGQAFTITPGAGSVLVIDGDADAGVPSALPGMLRGAGIAVEVRNPSAAPMDLLELQAFDLVVLHNVAADEMGLATQDALVAFVRDLGGGLLMTGGRKSFGAGGWAGSPIEPILPVHLDLPQRLVTPEVAIVFVLDNSGSMAQSVLGSRRSQQQIANEAAARAVEVLDETDLVGVISFNNTMRVVVPVRSNAKRGDTQGAIRSIGSGGGTNLPPALDAADAQLASIDAKLKHVIVLSDGRSLNAEALPIAADRMRNHGVRVTTIAVGDDADTQAMREVAERGGGAFYHVTNPEVLPRVFLKAVRVVRSPLVREEPFEPVLAGVGSPLTAGIGRPPALGGLTLTRHRDEPTVLTPMRSDRGEPVLAHWPVGLGQVVAFTSNADAWGDGWDAWDARDRFWTQLVRSASRSTSASASELSITTDQNRVSITMRALDDAGRAIDGLIVPAAVYAPDGSQRRVLLDQTGPGVYEASFDARASGVHIVTATPRRAGERLAPLVGGVVIASSAEQRHLATNDELLAELASTTGGRVLSLAEPGSARLFEQSIEQPRRAMLPLWPALLGWSLFVFLVDVGCRRIAWDRLVFKTHEGGLRRVAADAVRDRSSRAEAFVEDLSGEKDQRELRRRSIPRPEALDERDIAAARKRVLEQRRQAEQQRLARIREEMKQESRTTTPPPSPATRASESKPSLPDEGDTPTSLLSAKRRAQQRFGHPDDGGGSDGTVE